MHTEKHGTETHLNKIEARAGSRNKTNRNALVAGMLLILVLFTVIVGFGFFQTNRTGADEASSQRPATEENKQQP